ncbi:Uma2 family endonuclease [Streptomyces mirabilis]|uniref:Uma2 family endonuclease n=1 Tax=Streptomyces mirabilis TaxID=68239 RepID=UPI0036DB4408
MAVTLGRRRVWIPDVVVAAQGPGASADEDGIGVVASAVHLVAEVVSQGERHQERDRVRKRRAYARAGIPVYVIIDAHDNQGTVTDVTIPEGPAKAS